jgi:Zn-finger domain-containing protein
VQRLERSLNERRDLRKEVERLNSNVRNAHSWGEYQTQKNALLKTSVGALNKEKAELEGILKTCRYAITVQAMAIYELETMLGHPDGIKANLWMREFYDKVAVKFPAIQSNAELVTNLIKHSVKTVAES